MNTCFNKNDIYETEIAEHINIIKQVCSREGMPMFVTVCVENNDRETGYRNDMISAKTHGVTLKDDRIPEFVNVTLGFNTVPPTEVPEIDFD